MGHCAPVERETLPGGRAITEKRTLAATRVTRLTSVLATTGGHMDERTPSTKRTLVQRGIVRKRKLERRRWKKHRRSPPTKVLIMAALCAITEKRGRSGNALYLPRRAASGTTRAQDFVFDGGTGRRNSSFSLNRVRGTRSRTRWD